jgi:hypothetical protein
MIDILLGYLLDALESHDTEEVLRALQSEPELNRQLELLRQALVPLEMCREVITAPPNLAERTWVLIHQTATVVEQAVEPS